MKAKTILPTIALLISSLFVQAQDKYEFMIIEYTTLGYVISVSIDGKEYIKQKADFANQEKTDRNANPLLQKVKEYQDKDWELMNFNTTFISGSTAEVYYAYMRKKKIPAK